MNNLLTDIFRWLKKPDDKKLDLSSKQKINIFKTIFLLDIILIILGTTIRSLIGENIINLDKSHPPDPSDFINLILSAVFVGPIIEELVFRFPLIYKRNYLIRLINMCTSGWLKEKWHKYYKFFLYVSILTFGFIHALNYNNNGFIFIILLPLILFENITHGILFSYSRVKLGFIWSLIQHSANNLLVSIVIYFGNIYLLNSV